MTNEKYRELIELLLPDITDTKVLRRVWRILEYAYIAEPYDRKDAG